MKISSLQLHEINYIQIAFHKNNLNYNYCE